MYQTHDFLHTKIRFSTLPQLLFQQFWKFCRLQSGVKGLQQTTEASHQCKDHITSVCKKFQPLWNSRCPLLSAHSLHALSQWDKRWNSLVSCFHGTLEHLYLPSLISFYFFVECSDCELTLSLTGLTLTTCLNWIIQLDKMSRFSPDVAGFFQLMTSGWSLKFMVVNIFLCSS